MTGIAPMIVATDVMRIGRSRMRPASITAASVSMPRAFNWFVYSILLVEYTNQLKARGMETLAAVIEAGRIRLRPILMTSVATIMGAIPVMIGLGAGSTSRRPLGYAIVGGIFFSTVLTLFVVPVAYTLLDRLRARAPRAVRRGAAQPVEAD